MKSCVLTGVFIGFTFVLGGNIYATEDNQREVNSARFLAYYQPYYYQSNYYRPRYYQPRYYQPRYYRYNSYSYQSRYKRYRSYYQPRYARSDRRYNRPRYATFRNNPPQRIRGGGTNTLIFDPAHLRWYAYDSSGRLVRSGRASGGKGYCPDTKRGCRTPVGHFRVHSKGGPGCVSNKFPLNRRLPRAPMPYCMFFLRQYAVHGSPDVPNYNASHGCVRVPTSDAYWLSSSFVRHGTRVIVRPYGRR